MFQAHVFLQVHRLTCREVALNAMNSLSIVNNAHMSFQVELGGCLKLATRMSAGMTNSIVNGFDVLTKFPFPFALVVALVTTMNNSQVFSLIVDIEFRFAFAFVATNITHLHNIQVDNFDVVHKNALTPHFYTTVFTSKPHPLMLGFDVVLKSVCSHTRILAASLLTHVRVLFMDMAEMTFQVELAPSFELAAIDRALIAAVAVLLLQVALQCLTCVRFVITLATMQFDLQVRSSYMSFQV